MGLFDDLAESLTGSRERALAKEREWRALVRRTDALGHTGREGVARGLRLYREMREEAFPVTSEEQRRMDAGLPVFQDGSPQHRASERERADFTANLSLRLAKIEAGVTVDKRGLDDRAKDGIQGWEIGLKMGLFHWKCSSEYQGLNNDVGNRLHKEMGDYILRIAYGNP